MPIQDETPEQTDGMLEKLYLRAGFGRTQLLPRAVGGSGRGEEDMDLPAQTAYEHVVRK